MRDLIICIICTLLGISNILNAMSIVDIKQEIKELKQNKVTLICDNYVYKQNLNQALAKNCYVISREDKGL